MGLLKVICDVQYSPTSNYVPKSIKDTGNLGNMWLARAPMSLKIAVVFVFCSLVDAGLVLLLKCTSRFHSDNGSWEWQKPSGTWVW